MNYYLKSCLLEETQREETLTDLHKAFAIIYAWRFHLSCCMHFCGVFDEAEFKGTDQKR